jgi:hypothetical protein
MTESHDEHGDILRRALSAEANTVVPAADGLERIRARISEQPPPRFGWAWFTASWPRPVMAVAAALFVVTIALSQPALSKFTSAGGHGDPEAGEHGAAGTSGTAVPGSSREPSDTPLEPQKSGQVGSAISRPPRPSPAAPACGRGGTEATAPSGSESPAPQVSSPDCPTPTTPTSPDPVVTTTPPPPPVTPPPPSTQSADPQPQSTTDAVPAQGTT